MSKVYNKEELQLRINDILSYLRNIIEDPEGAGVYFSDKLADIFIDVLTGNGDSGTNKKFGMVTIVNNTIQFFANEEEYNIYLEDPLKNRGLLLGKVTLPSNTSTTPSIPSIPNIDLSNYVTLNTDQNISGIKNFLSGIKVNNSPIITYDSTTKSWLLEGNLIVTGGGAFRAALGDLDVPTIMDAINTDEVTISKEGGILKVLKAGLDRDELIKILSEEKYATQTWVTDKLTKFALKSDIPDTSTLVDLSTYQEILEVKDFKKGLKLNSSPIVTYDSTTKSFLFDGNIVVTGGGVFRATLGDIDAPTIMDAILVDEQTIIKEGGILKINPNIDLGGGIKPEELQPYLEPYAKIDYVANTYATIEDLNNFLTGSDTDTIINKWKELETFLEGLSESDDLATLLSGKADKATTLSGYGITDAYTNTEVDTLLLKYVRLEGTAQDIKVRHNFTEGLKIGGLSIYKSQDDVIYIDSNVVISRGLTVRGTDGTTAPSIWESIPFDDTMKWDGSQWSVVGGGGGASVTYDSVVKALGFTPLSTAGGIISGSIYFGNKSYPEIRGNGSYLTFSPDNMDGSKGSVGLYKNADGSYALRRVWDHYSYGVMDLGASGYRWHTVYAKSGNFSDSVTATSFIGNLTGTADSAKKLQTSRTIWGQKFDGTNDIANNTIGTMRRLEFVNTDTSTVVGYIGCETSNNNHVFINASQNNQLRLGTSSGIALTITESSNVAIGGTTTDEKLHVHGAIKANSITLSSGSDSKIRLDNTDTETKYHQIVFLQNGVEYGRLGTYRDDNICWNQKPILHSGNYSAYALPLTGGTVNGKLELNSSAAVNLNSAEGILCIGSKSTNHLSIDANDIQAKSSPTTAGTLYLNTFGGKTVIGSSGYNVNVDGNLVVANTIDAYPIGSIHRIRLIADNAASYLQAGSSDAKESGVLRLTGYYASQLQSLKLHAVDTVVSGHITIGGALLFDGDGNYERIQAKGSVSSYASNADAGFNAHGSKYSLFFGIGSGNVNRGIYDNYHKSWWIQRSESTDTYIPIGNVAIGKDAAYNKLDVYTTSGWTGGFLTPKVEVTLAHAEGYGLSINALTTASEDKYLLRIWQGSLSGSSGSGTAIFSVRSTGNVIISQSKWDNGLIINRTVASSGAGIVFQSQGNVLGNFGISGAKQFEISGANGLKFYVDVLTGNLLSYGGITARYTSDERLKTNLRPINAGKMILSLGRVREFEYIDSEVEKNNLYKGSHIGLIYQDVKGSALSKMCFEREDGYGSLNYYDTSLKALLVGVAQEHEIRLTEDERDIKTLKEENKALRKEIEQLKQRVV